MQLVGSRASTIISVIVGIDSDGDESKLKRGVMVMAAKLVGFILSHATSTLSWSRALSGIMTEVQGTGFPALWKGSSIRFI